MSQYEVCSLVNTTARREKEGLFADGRKILPVGLEIFLTGGKRIDFPACFSIRANILSLL